MIKAVRWMMSVRDDGFEVKWEWCAFLIFVWKEGGRVIRMKEVYLYK